MSPSTTSPIREAACEPAPPAQVLRRLPTPQWDPPYDDEVGLRDHRRRRGRAATDDGVQGTLALAFVLPSGLPATPEPPRLRLVTPVPDGDAGGDDDDVSPQPTPRALLPEPRRWAIRLVQALVEVLAGDRPATQLVRWTAADVLADVQRRLTVTARRCPPGRSGAARAVVRSVRVSEPRDGVAEVCALVQRGPRTTALALRLDGLDGRWQCTALELG